MMSILTKLPFCYKECKHGNYCIKIKKHKGKHIYHNSARGLIYSYCDCRGNE